MEHTSNGRLFQSEGPKKEKNLAPKVLFVDGMQRVKVSEDK